MALLDAEGMGAVSQLNAGGGICVRSVLILKVICVTLRVSRELPHL